MSKGKHTTLIGAKLFPNNISCRINLEFFSTLKTLFNRPFVIMMSFVVCTFHTELKVFYSIIVFSIVYMMDALIRFKLSSKMLLHNKAMFEDISVRSNSDTDISFSMFIPTTFPSVVFGTLTVITDKFLSFFSMFVPHRYIVCQYGTLVKYKRTDL